MPTPRKLLAFEDPDHPGNASSHHTGKKCVEHGCDRPAGTLWSPLWCHPCNVERMRRIGASLKGAARGASGNRASELIEQLLQAGVTARPGHAVPSPYACYPTDGDETDGACQSQP